MKKTLYGIGDLLVASCNLKIPFLLNYLADGHGLTSACYSMGNDLKWTHFASLTKPKFGIASVIVKNGLWVTGNGDKFKQSIRAFN